MKKISTADIIGYIAGSCASFLTIPQIIHIVKRKKAEDLSLYTVIMLLIIPILYTIYGFMIDSFPLIITDCISIFFTMILLYFKIYYDYFY